MKKIILVSLIMISFLQAEFIRNDNLDIVWDTENNLLWQDEKYTVEEGDFYNKDDNWESEYGKILTWQNAKEYCENLTLGGVNDWFLPDINNFKTLITDSSINIRNENFYIYIDKVFENNFPQKSKFLISYWTSTEDISNSFLALAIHFDNGTNDSFNKIGSIYVRCVREVINDFNPSTFASLTTLYSVNEKPTLDIYSNKTQITLGDSLYFTSNANDSDGYIDSYYWNFGDRYNSTSTEANPTYTYNQAGTYQVICTVTDNEGATTTKSLSINVESPNTSPTLTISTSKSTINIGDSVYFTANANDTDGYIDSYYWNFGDGSTSSSTNPSHPYTKTGTYNVTCTVIDNDGAITTKNLTITVESSNNPPTLTIDASKLIINEGESIVFDENAKDSDGYIDMNSYKWDFGDGSTSTDRYSSIHRYYKEGVYKVSCSVTDNDGATTTTTLSIIVNKTQNSKIEFIRNNKFNVVWDSKSNLLWQDNSEVQSIEKDWYSAISYCKNLNFAGFDDWYLPSLDELKSILITPMSSIINDTFENIKNDNYYLTSTSSPNGNGLIWIVYFNDINNQRIITVHDSDGNYEYAGSTTKNYFVRCVRKSNNEFVSSTFASLTNLQSTLNSTPTVTSQNKTVNSGEILTFTSNDFLAGFSDSDGDNLVKIKITKLPTIGNLKLNGINIYLNQEISVNELNSLTFSANVEETIIISFSGKAYDGYNWSDEANMYIITIKGKPNAPLTASKKVIYFNGNMLEKYMKIEAVGGEEPYNWSAKYGDFKYLNSDKSIVVYKPHSSLTFDDTITLTDKSGESIKIEAKYIKELEVTPSVRYIFRGSETTFTIIGGIAPFEAIVIDGDAEIVSKVDNKVTIKASNLTSIFHVKFSDSSGQEIIKEINVVDELKLSPQIAYFDDFRDNLEIKIYGGVGPYSATASAGDVSVDGDIAIYEPENRYSEQNVTIKDSLGQEASMKILVENVNALTISPSNPSVDIGSLTPFKAKLGTGSYDWSIQKGELDKYSGESVIYTAPEYDTIDKLTVIDSSGAKFSAIIIVGNAKINNKILNLKKGWNLISIPIDISLYKLSENTIPPIGSMNMSIFNSYEVIWKYLNEWIKNPEVINQSEGFWIKQIKDDIVEFEGDEYVPTNFTTLTNGWHLMGTGSTINNLKELFNLEEIWIYENEKGWSKNPATIEAGEGFWVKK